MAVYTAITFAPVQGFIEKSRKLRDLFGASLILSYLSAIVVDKAHHTDSVIQVISPGLPHLQKGMPNRILIKGKFSHDDFKNSLLSTWKIVLDVCRDWVEKNLSEFHPYDWEKEWAKWGNHTWEIFWAEGGSPEAAMDNLEAGKLSRDWIAVNWIGESSSLTGTDAIAWPGLGANDRNPQYIDYGKETDAIKTFYKQLAWVLDGKKLENKENPEGKFIAPNEKLSIPELVKRLVTLPAIAKQLHMEELDTGFQEIERKPTEKTPGQWTGWFMGDGDKVGDYLKELARTQGDEGIKKFTDAMRTWGKNFEETFSKDTKLGRVIYAGGDDFLGVIYTHNPAEPISTLTAFEWLNNIPDKWQEHKQNITVSVGLVWVGGSVPQRDVLQHCREAEKRAKSLGRNRVTIRVVFNSGQYVQWTCPWDYLYILKKYCDRDRKTYSKWERSGKDPNQQPNWSHIYSDLAQLKARHALGLTDRENDAIANNNEILKNRSAVLEFFDVYFPNYKEDFQKKEQYLVGAADDASQAERAKAMTLWICDLITVGWYLCSDTLSSSNL